MVEPYRDMPIEKMLCTLRSPEPYQKLRPLLSPNTYPPRLAMLFFLDAIEETHNNDHPLAIYRQKTPLLLKKNMKTFGCPERDTGFRRLQAIAP
jgi:hypothetical protein